MVSHRRRVAPVVATLKPVDECTARCDEHWRSALAALACLLLVAPVNAQQARPVGAWRPVANPIAGWHALGPVLLSVTAVAGFGTGDLNVPEPGSTFVLAAIEPGIHGGRVSLALAHWLRFEGGGILRATALRFWSGSPTRTYLGVEASG